MESGGTHAPSTVCLALTVVPVQLKVVSPQRARRFDLEAERGALDYAIRCTRQTYAARRRVSALGTDPRRGYRRQRVRATSISASVGSRDIAGEVDGEAPPGAVSRASPRHASRARESPTRSNKFAESMEALRNLDRVTGLCYCISLCSQHL